MSVRNTRTQFNGGTLEIRENMLEFVGAGCPGSEGLLLEVKRLLPRCSVTGVWRGGVRHKGQRCLSRLLENLTPFSRSQLLAQGPTPPILSPLVDGNEFQYLLVTLSSPSSSKLLLRKQAQTPLFFKPQDTKPLAS